MTEAFEIGVTLALSDGVSDSIARARKDMAAFEQTLMTGGVSVAELRKAAIEALVPTKRQPEAPQAEPRPDGDIVKEAPVVSAVTGSIVQPDRTPIESGDATPPHTRFIEEHMVADWQAPFRRDVALIGPMPDAAPQPGSERLGDQARASWTAAPTVAAASHAVPVTADSAEECAAPVMMFHQTISPDSSTWAGEESAPRLPDATALYRTGSAYADYRVGAVHTNESLGDAAVTAVPPAPYDPPTLSYDSAREQSLVEPAMPRAGDGRAVWQADARQSREVPAAPIVSAVADPGSSTDRRPVAAEAQRPAEGDVYLDGMLVGRWMSRFLAREAGRASVGPTGFDARRGRLLPGATVGN